MTDFFDWLTASDQGAAAERLRERFRLSPDEMRRIAESLAPAFLIGFQRLMAQPDAFNDFLRRAMLFGTQGRFGDGPAAGRPFLNELFGGSPLFEAVARQASTVAGVAPDTIRAMMPDLALLSAEAMARMAATGAGSVPANAFPGDGAGRTMAEAMRRSANAVEALNRPSGASGRPAGADLNALFADALRGGFPWIGAFDPSPRGTGPAQATPQASPQAGAQPFPFAALFPLMEAVTKGLALAAPPKPEPEPEPSQNEMARTASPMLQMMEAGHSLQQSYTMEMLALFDRHRPRP